MAETYRELSEAHQHFIARQHLFFVATAPLDANGHVNLSPKGYDTLRILSPRNVAYLDLTGSGNETSGHIAENQRVTLMFCAFEGSPQILRLYGTGSVILPGTPRWAELIPRFETHPGARQIIDIRLEAVKTSCGYGVPLLEYRGERDTMHRWAVQKGEDGIERYWREMNRTTIDGCTTPLGEALLPLGDQE